jgi:hypothetical protein
MAGTTGSARQEAERLVATVLAMAGQSGLGAAARGAGAGGLGDLVNGVVGQFLGGSGQQQHKGSGWATGSAECCVCPVCKAIAATRDPSPERAERLASGAGDLATGMASMLRGFSKVASATGTKPRPKQQPRPAPTPDQAWSAATRDPKPAEPTSTDQSADPWTAATRTPAPERKPSAAGKAAQATAPSAAEKAAQATVPSAPEKAAQATAPSAVGPAAQTAAEQAAAQTDAAGLEAVGEEALGEEILGGEDASPGGDPWAAATRAPKRPRRAETAARPAAPAVAPDGHLEGPGPATEGADSALPEIPGSAGVAVDRPGARIEKSSSVFPGEGDAVGVDHDGPAAG